MAAPQPTENDVRAAAFRALLATGRPASAASLAASLAAPDERVRAALDALDRDGLIRRDRAGAVVGSFGLSVVPSRHVLVIGDRRFWTWCAYDAVGILAALGSEGVVRSVCAASGVALELRFRSGEPEPSPAVIVMPDRSSCRSVVEEWCPHVNFVEDEPTARTMLRLEGRSARVLPVAEAARRGGAVWSRALAPPEPAGPGG